MKRFLTASLAGAVLVASQAAAALPNSTPFVVGDRAAASQSETANEFMGMPLPVIILTILIIGGFIWAVSEGDDGPSSP